MSPFRARFLPSKKMSPQTSPILSLLLATLSVQTRAETSASCPAPSPCTCDAKIIWCSNKGLTTVPNFQISDQYTALHMTGNNIEEIPSNAFRNLPNLMRITISDKLRTVHANAFDGLSQLVELTLNKNQLQSLPDAIFDSLSNLSELYLINNKLKSFPVKSLARAVKGRTMDYLYLQENPKLPCPLKDEITSQIQTPSNFGFPSPCRAQTCHAPSPCTCGDDTKIYCENRALENVPKFQSSDFYTTIYLNYNNIEEIYGNAFRNLSILTSLDISSNRLTTIHNNAFYGLSQLGYLNLENNHLQTLPENVFDYLTQLSRLFLDHNRLTDFPVMSLGKAVGGRKMKELSLENNPNLSCDLKEEILSAIQMPENFQFPSPCQAATCPAPSPCTCSGIEVSCDNKELTTVPNFQPSRHYTVLTLSTNRIDEILANAFSNLNQLTHLHIFNNKVSNVHGDAFQGLSQLVYLDFGNNELKTLPGNVFDPLTKLSKLFMDNNKLTNFPAKSLAKAVKGRKMSSLYLQENPNLPCNLKQEILSAIQTPSSFNTPSPCGVPPAV